MTLIVLRRLSLVAASVAFLACRDVTHGDGRSVAILLSLPQTTRVASAVVDSPFVSVIDTLNLSIAPASGGPAAPYGAHVNRGRKAIPFGVELDKGTYRFTASVQSKNASVLFVGDTTVTIDADHFNLVFLLRAVTPVLVVAPDTALTILDDGKSVVARVSVHNRGLDSLSWQLSSRPAIMSTCPQTCAAFPDSGRLGAGTSQALTFFVPNTFAPQVLCFTVSSLQGDVPVCWRKT